MDPTADRRTWGRRLGRMACWTVAMGVLACGGDDDGPCATVRVLSATAENRGTTSSCGPEAVSEEVTTTPAGTEVTVTYRTLIMACGGTVRAVATAAGNRVTLDEEVIGGGECGCFGIFDLTVTLDLCATGVYMLVIDGREHPVTL